MNYFENNNQRELYIETLKKQLIGPDGDIFGFPDSEEIISEPPHRKYYSGILFSPIFQMETEKEETNEEESAEKEIDKLATEDTNQNYSNSTEDEEISEENNVAKSESPSAIYKATNPNSCGLVFVLNDISKPIKISFEYSQYKINTSDRVIKLNENEYKSLLDVLSEIECSDNIKARYGEVGITKELIYEDGTLKLKNIPEYQSDKSLTSESETKKELVTKKISSDSDFLKIFYEKTKQLLFVRRKFIKLLGSSYKRSCNKFETEVSINNIETSHTEDIISDHLKYHIKTMELLTGKKMVRVLLENSKKSEKKKYEDCFFQVKIRVSTDALDTYHDRIKSVIDEDLSIVELQYEKQKSFGKGVNCAVCWENAAAPKWIETTFMPEVDIKSFSNDVHKDIKGKDFVEVLELYKLSVWGLDDNDLITKLTDFANAYGVWIETQKNEASGNQEANSLIANQTKTKDRLIKNINYLSGNQQAMTCFRLANTAMMMQMITARDTRFKKPRHLDEITQGEETFKEIDFFSKYNNDNEAIKLSYRPFQLAFLLMNVESTFNKESKDRNDIVDLIWFPTGGGKTEAYLALTALTILERRTTKPDAKGISVLMRYTLRLLTAQQFERATWLICALEFIRKNQNEIGINGLNLGDDRHKITIGMWVGQSTSPNQYNEITQRNSKYQKFFEDVRNGNLNVNNPFPISYCPWCGCKLIKSSNATENGYSLTNNIMDKIKCPNSKCAFYPRLPISFIDEDIYANPPSLLFATVDKTVRISHRSKNDIADLFNKETPPDLIIQDELHLLSGPLGSLTGLYESIIDLLCTNDGQKPKIVASTATTRNTKSLVKQMYNRELNVFPPQGVRYNDNFFSFTNEDSKRRHIGFIPSGHTSVATEIKIVATLFYAKILLLKEFLQNNELTIEVLNSDDFKSKIDPYWAMVLYYNSLRDLGRSNSRVSQEFIEQIGGIFNRFGIEDELKFIYQNLSRRSEEFTSRQDSGKIKELLNKLSDTIKFIQRKDNKIYCDDNSIDLSLVSNMFSVGIDVNRLNLMLMMGQPNTVAEYIQASSRVARKDKGLVINMLNPMRAREMSFFEDYTGFHNSYYKNVEPLSITPFTEVAVEKLLNAILISYVKDKLGLNANEFTLEYAEGLYALIETRIINDEQRSILKNSLDTLAKRWVEYRIANNNLTFDDLRKKPEFILMGSLRDIDVDVFIQNTNLNYVRN